MRTTSALVGKAYSAAGQAAACLHTMSLLHTYQAELLADLNEGGGIGPNVVCELRLATGLSLRVVKETAKSISRSMAALVVTEIHLWLNLSNIKGKDKNVLMDAPISSSGLFGNAVSICIPESRPPSYSFLWGCWVGAAPNIQSQLLIPCRTASLKSWPAEGSMKCSNISW